MELEMNIFSRSRAIVLVLVGLVLSVAAMQTLSADYVLVAPNVVTTKPDSNVSNSTFYAARPDLRRCASPMCGGYFVRRVNYGLTRCANGRQMSECYVSSIDWNGIAEVEVNSALLKGSIVTKGNRNGHYGVLKVSEVWRAADDGKPYGDFYRVRDLGIRCIAAPCLTHQEAKLNTPSVRKIAGVALDEAGAGRDVMEQAQTALTSTTGIIVAGGHSTVTGPAGRALTLKAAQFYLPQSSSAAGMKPCIKTGCSGQICSDHEVISTCEYKPEYECYKKATCERQANGDCGFTKTKELTDCLARVR
jgi:hypothetical protein